MFSQASVILFTAGGCVWCIPACTGADTRWADTPPRQTPPGQTPSLGRHPPVQTTPGQTPPGTTPPPQEMATAGDGTHPTGMHSCFEFVHYRGNSKSEKPVETTNDGILAV